MLLLPYKLQKYFLFLPSGRNISEYYSRLITAFAFNGFSKKTSYCLSLSNNYQAPKNINLNGDGDSVFKS